MSQILISDYLKQIDLNLVFLAEYPLKTATKTNISVDGALLHELRMPPGYWEAKDAADDLDEEIGKKFRKGYPQDNIVFSDDTIVVLWQHRQEVMRCPVEDTAALEKLLKLFFGYEQVEPFDLTRHGEPDTKARAAVQQPKALLRSDPAAGSITLDSETTLRGVPPQAWAYKLGNRCAIDLLQHVTTVSVETVRITEAMKGVAR